MMVRKGRKYYAGYGLGIGWSFPLGDVPSVTKLVISHSLRVGSRDLKAFTIGPVCFFGGFRVDLQIQ